MVELKYIDYISHVTVHETLKKTNLSPGFEFIYTPKHGSWLNKAEIELHVLNGQSLKRHIATKEKIISEVNAWQTIETTKTQKLIGSLQMTKLISNLKDFIRQF